MSAHDKAVTELLAFGRTCLEMIAAPEYIDAAEDLAYEYADRILPGWQTIETAPKDGRWILAHDPMQGTQVMRWGVDMEGFARWTNHVVKPWRDRDTYSFRPEYWMPVPEAP